MEEVFKNQYDQVKSREKVFESRFEAIAQTASDPIIIFDENSLIVFSNKKVFEVFGYTEEELVEHNLSKLFPQNIAKELVEDIKHFIEVGNSKFIGQVVEMEGLKKDRTVFPLELSMSTWTENGSHFFSGLMRDISRRKRYINEIHQLNESLQLQQNALETANENLSYVNNELYSSNQELVTQKKELEDILQKLNSSYTELEQKVEERTMQLSKRENQLQLVADALPVLITYVDKNQRYRFNNLTYEKWFKKSRSEVYGMHLKDVLGDTAYEVVKDTVKKVLAGETIYRETEINYKGVGPKTVSINYIPHKVEGEVIGYYALIADLTEQKKAQNSLLQANEEIKLLLEREKAAYAEVAAQKNKLYNLLMQAPSLVAIVSGKDFVFELANPPFLELLALNTSIEGKSLLDIIPNIEADLLKVLNNVYIKGERFLGKEFPVHYDWKHDGEPYTRYFNMIYEPVKELDGTISGILFFGFEVTDHVISRENLEKNAWIMKQMNKALKKKNQDLKKLNIDLDNFIYTASHDLKSPAVNLEGLVSLLKSEFSHKFEYRGRNLLDMIETSIHKLYKTIFDLTEITKVQKDIGGALEEVSLKELFEEVKTDLIVNIQQNNTAIEENIKVDKFLFNKSNLRSILYNLLSNALKYRSPERDLKVNISSFIEKDSVVLCIKDNGLGVDEHQLPKLFTMFKRLHTHVEGTGIGLYIIKRIIENNGGKILVESEKNVGTIFKVYFPTLKTDIVIS